ncbi:hypothetical protein SAMN05428958_11612 [Pantoea sesami]|nr:hypothetical protein SAMN05428958_11612 [Pantoea sesami]
MSNGNSVMKQKRSIVTPTPGSLEFGVIAVSDVSGNTRLFVGDQNNAPKEFQAKTPLLTNLIANANNGTGIRKALVAVNGTFEQALLVTAEYADPDQNTDIRYGFVPGSMYYNANNGKLWSALDTGTGAAEWQLVTEPYTPLTSPMLYKGVIDCSSNPNYPASEAGFVYAVSVAGKIGGPSGVAVESGDLILCKATTSAGNQASAGSSFDIVQANIDGAVRYAGGTTLPQSVPVFTTNDGKTIGSSGKTATSESTADTFAMRNQGGSLQATGFIPTIAIRNDPEGYGLLLDNSSPSFIFLESQVTDIGFGILPDSNTIKIGQSYTLVNTGASEIEVHAFDNQAPGNINANVWWIAYKNTVTTFVLKGTSANGAGNWDVISLALANTDGEVQSKGIRLQSTTHNPPAPQTLNVSLTRTSDRVQIFINQNVAGQQSTVTLPDASELNPLTEFQFLNNSDAVLKIKDYGGTQLATVAVGSSRRVTLADNSTNAGIWDFEVNTANNDGGTF